MGLVHGFPVSLMCWVGPIGCSYFGVLAQNSNHECIAACLSLFPQFFCHFQCLVDLCIVFYDIISLANM